jgi:catechol 2,3-dioxygenase-like lactoylglutathione lyase family enzyme
VAVKKMTKRKTRRVARTRTAATRKKTPKPTARKPAPGRVSLAALKTRRRKERESLRLRALEPSLTVDDIERSVRFYTEVLGFYLSEEWRENGVLRGVNLLAGVCELGLSQDDWAQGRDRKKGVGMRIWCRTDQDIDTMAAQIKAAGGTLTEEPVDQAWGVRSLAIVDPDGYRFTIYRETSR